MVGGSAGRVKPMLGVELDVCWLYKVLGLNGCRLLDERNVRLSIVFFSKIDEG